MPLTALRSLLLAAALPLVCAAQSTVPVAEYRDFVHAYRLKGASVVGSFVAVSHARLATAIDAALSGSGDSLLSWEELRAAALLHSEATLEQWKRSANNDADFHLSAARRVIDRVVARQPSQDDFARRWYDLMGNLARHAGLPKVADQMVALGRNRWPHDPGRNHFRRGLEAEARGSIGGLLVVSNAGRHIETKAMPATLYDRAAREYTAALALNPRLHEAALHLGRVRMVQGKLAAAEHLLQQALSSADPRIPYLALLFLGSLDERNGRFAEAEARYREAQLRYPEGQSAPFALAQFLSRTGREVESRAIVASHLTPGRERVVEPLWTYLATPDRELAARFDELRVEVWR